MDAAKGVRAPAFDHARLAAALSAASGHAYEGERLPFDAIEFTGDGTRKPYGALAPSGTRDIHTFAGHWWLVVGADDRPLTLFVGESRAGIAEIR